MRRAAVYCCIALYRQASSGACQAVQGTMNALKQRTGLRAGVDTAVPQLVTRTVVRRNSACDRQAGRRLLQRSQQPAPTQAAAPEVR